ncbi:hypothetical protein ACSBR1_031829 [Camellia fascicularis]
MSSWNDHPGNKQMQRQRSLPKLASDHSSYSGGTTEEDLFSCELWISSQRDEKPYEHRSYRKDSMAQQECNDEYEVLETSKVERSSYPAKRTINSKLSEAEMAFIQQKFMAAKRLSKNDKLHNSKEFCDMLDMLDANKDLLIKFL